MSSTDSTYNFKDINCVTTDYNLDCKGADDCLEYIEPHGKKNKSDHVSGFG